MATAGRTTGDYLYILASESNTRVELTNGESFSLVSGQSRSLVISSMEYVAIRADKPVLVCQVSDLYLSHSGIIIDLVLTILVLGLRVLPATTG